MIENDPKGPVFVDTFKKDSEEICKKHNADFALIFILSPTTSGLSFHFKSKKEEGLYENIPMILFKLAALIAAEQMKDEAQTKH